jgi:protein-tyrosine phosphatase
MKILMVCLGNICRSPLAEGLLQHKADEHGLTWVVESAGTNGLHNGERPHHLSQKVAKQNGIDISKQCSRKFIADDFEKYDRIFVMADDVLSDIKRIAGNKFNPDKIDFFLNALHPKKNNDVPDPWYGDEDGYTEVYALIDKTCDAIIENHLASANKKEKYNDQTKSAARHKRFCCCCCV